ARALEQSSPGAAAGPIAGHWRRSGVPGWAAHCVRWARAAACSAAAALAYDEAAQFAVLALETAEAGAISGMTGSEGTAGSGTTDAALRAELTLDAAQAEFAAGHIEASVARGQAGRGGRPARPPRGCRPGHHRDRRPPDQRGGRRAVRQRDPRRPGQRYRRPRP